MATITGTDNSETIDQDAGVTQDQDIINALGGNDFVFGLGGSDEIHGGSGNDDIFGDLGFTTSAGSDLLFGDAGNDILRGEAGDDVLEGGAGADFLVGGDGVDTASYANSPAGVSVNLTNGVVAGGDAVGDTFSNIENLKGSGHADTLIGNGGDNLLVDSGGNDTLIGGFGDDIYVSIDGNDAIIEAVDAGHDSLVFSSQVSGSMKVIPDNVEDMLLDDSGNNLALNGFGNKLDNFIQGSGGPNEIFGLAGNDTLSGQAGFDFLTGGKGKDKLTGGLDRDFFIFNSIGESKRGAQRDVIEDFERGDNVVGDEINVSGIDAKQGAGNQKFKFIGKQDFHDRPGELRYIDRGETCIVQADVNGDGKADFEILVKVGALGKGDFIL